MTNPRTFPTACLLLSVTFAWGCGAGAGAGESDALISGGGEDSGIGGLDDDTAGSDAAASSSSGGEDGSATSSSGGGDGGATSSSGGADGGASSSGGGDGGTGDAADTSDLNCPGGAGCDCKANADCDTAYCLDFPGGKKCAQLCTETCPQGLACKDISGGKGDQVFACVLTLIALCAPCMDDQICGQNGVPGLCLDYGAEGRFCGGPCKADDECPTDYECVEATGVAGTSSKQCKLKADAPNPVCGCSEWATNQGAKTECNKTNALGSCKAERQCTVSGLQACVAGDAKAELCNAQDDDCNGTVDDLAADYKCSNKLFAALGSAATCTTDTDCAGKGADGAVEKCAIAAGKTDGFCKQLEGECFGVPSCTAAGKLVCNEAKTPFPESCDLQDNDCDGKTDETFGWQGPDDKTVGMGQPCGFGECGGGNVTCATLNSATCDTQSKAKDEKCDGLDNDCNGATDDKDVVCNDDNACTNNECDGSDGSCANPPAVECDDKNPCTADSCDKKTGKCSNALSDGASCDDGNACTEGDVCGAAGNGDAACLPGAATKSCDDANLCTDDSCDADKGCVALANAVTQACYSGDPQTMGVGECVGGYKACSDGALQGACVGEFSPSNQELCDAKDDDCNGVTDNGCAATVLHVRTATAAGRVGGAGDKYTVRMRLSGESAVHGVAQGAQKSGAFGWYAWLAALLK